MQQSNRALRLAQLRGRVGHRQLFWFGIRGEDAKPLLALPQFAGSFAITAPLSGASLSPSHNYALEQGSGSRVDLDRYDLDFDASAHADDFRAQLLRAVSTPCILLTYRPSAFTSALAFSMRDTLTLAGMHKDRQAAFEHKPWVETSLSVSGRARTIDWTYVADQHRSIVAKRLREGPHILRTSRNSGGVGIAKVTNAADVDAMWPAQGDRFVAVAPFLEGAVPVNLAACLFSDGKLTYHPPSVQLIGIDGLTDRPFGYCGNDFGAIKSFPAKVLDEMQVLLDVVGKWLRDERYVGAFGVDVLVQGDTVWFTEVNARLQGSTALGASIAADADEPDLLLDHLAANLGMTRGKWSPTVRAWAQQQPAVSHLVMHNVTDRVLVAGDDDHASKQRGRWTLDPGHARVEPGGALGRLLWDGAVTTDGFAVNTEVRHEVDRRSKVFVSPS